MDFLVALLRWLTVAVGLSMAGGTLLSLSQSPHWFIRGWDFPRAQIACIILVAGGCYALFFFEGHWFGWAFLGACAACVLWQAYRIFPYAPFAPKPVKAAAQGDEEATVRLVASNVLMENEDHEQWLEVVLDADPDLVLAVEVNDRWDEVISRLEEEGYEHAVRQPQDNYYGMVLYSRFELFDTEVRFVVQDDVPSIHTGVELPGGLRIWLHGVHPRPPEPLRDQGAAPRDAEVVIVGREIDAEERPTIVAGDFNDVAWSHTSALFQHVSQLLDPRKGRGLFNTFDARYPLFRFPLDHVFHSNDFKLIDLRRLPFVGSDHFPVCITLSYELSAPAEQPEPEKNGEHEEEAQEKIEEAADEDDEVMQDGRAPVQQEAEAPERQERPLAGPSPPEAPPSTEQS